MIIIISSSSSKVLVVVSRLSLIQNLNKSIVEMYALHTRAVPFKEKQSR